MKKLIIAGGTGFLGSTLSEFLSNDFGEIVILSRSASGKKGGYREVKWDAKTQDQWAGELEGADVVVNLTGKNINCRPTATNRKEILLSRVNATNAIGEAIASCKAPPALWINGSATNMYANSIDRVMSEKDFLPGNDYWAEVCEEWEHACMKWNLNGTRRVLPRVTPVFGKADGVYPVLRRLVKAGLGGTMGSGNQKVSWIHIEDYCRIIKWFIKNEKAEGAYNICAPGTLSNKDQMKIMRENLKMPFGIPSPSFVIRIGAYLIGTDADLILNSRNVYPGRLVDEGYEFKFPQFSDCIKNLTDQKLY